MVQEILKDQKFTYGQELQKLVVDELPNCIGCNECIVRLVNLPILLLHF
ncbi:MAG: hypothetical protein ACTSRX_07280 [Promethearchaeota archaeon]